MVIRRHKQKPAKERKLALDRIDSLFSEAEKQFKEHPELSNRYVELARKIAMKSKVRIRSELKKRLCKHCHSYLKLGINCRVRLSQKHMSYYCLNCRKFMRFPYN
ncbi:ribonuclease P [Candidatus Woesearchaeota archaeon]|nr:ribonuclease P [Candidatus Woesearchaeota archaeon]